MLLGLGSPAPRPSRPAVPKIAAAALLGLAGGAALAPSALAQAGGAAVRSASPALTGIACKSACPAPGTVERGGTITLRGQQLDGVEQVVFLGGRGTRDDARASARAVGSTRLDVTVPPAARSGQVALVTATGAAAQARRIAIKVVKPSTETLAAADVAPVLRAVPGIAGLEAGLATRRLGKGASGATVAYVSRAAATVSVRVDVVRAGDGSSVFDDTRTVDPGEQQTIAWNGRAGDGVALDGRYEVRISAGPESATRGMSGSAGAAAGGAAPAGSPPPPGSARLGAFTFLGAIFPVRGAHDYGQSGARFGAGRSGHSHEGQDVMAKCGTPVVAARGGVVKQKAVHGNAGNYVVISDALSGEDHGYMHFRAPALVDRGERVETGQLLGYVGDTGSATACHLHFEIWTAPGWYSGGSPIDPYATLKRWDKLS